MTSDHKKPSLKGDPLHLPESAADVAGRRHLPGEWRRPQHHLGRGTPPNRLLHIPSAHTGGPVNDHEIFSS